MKMVMPLLLDKYDYYGCGRDVDGRDEFQPILWKRDIFNLKDQGCFWLSETPDVPGSISWYFSQ